MTYKFTSLKDYKDKQNLAKDNPAEFWDLIANSYEWHKKWDHTYIANYQEAKFEWFQNAQLNISENCLDRHLETNGDKIAIIYEGNEENDQTIKLTYQELADKVNQYANLYQKYGIKKGDRICIYMPMIPDAIAACLACSRIGAIHSIVFAGFSANSLKTRLEDSKAKLLITSDKTYRGNKSIDLLRIVREAAKSIKSLEKIFIYQRENVKTEHKKEVIINYELSQQLKEYNPISMDAEDPLFILYTSGSTGTPKGVMHTTAGYMVYTGYSFTNIFDYRDDDVFFCTADIGWITGHSYMIYGPLLAGSTIVMFEGIPTHPQADRLWKIIEKHNVTTLYTAPTAIRLLMQFGNDLPQKYEMPTLRILGSVGEPINLEAWEWYNETIGKKRCKIVDTWWQTETGGMVISNLAGITNAPPTFAGKPLPGIDAVIMLEDGNIATEDNQAGYLCINKPWPSMIRSIWGNHKRCIETYYSKFPEKYLSGDGAFTTPGGNFRVTGRIDDVINTSGHRIGTAEIENAINKHPDVTESAVIGYPHKIKGESIKAYIIANNTDKDIVSEVKQVVKNEIGSIAIPEVIFITDDLPKTRSGKIMRRILKKLSVNDNDFGDISTLVNPEVIDKLKKIS